MSVKNFWLSVRNAYRALRNGDLLLKVRADKYYIHVMYVFLLMWLSIMESEAALVKIKSASATETRLKKLGSEAAMPKEPATVIKKR